MKYKYFVSYKTDSKDFGNATMELEDRIFYIEQIEIMERLLKGKLEYIGNLHIDNFIFLGNI